MEKEKIISLVCAVQQGEDEAQTNLYNVFHQDLYYHISKTVNDPALAEDLLQDTFIEIFQTIDQLNEPAAFVTWSKQIAYHRCTAYFRKRREILADEQEDGFSVFDTIEEDRAEFIPDEALDKEDLKQTLHAMIGELPPEQRSAILMRYFDEISVKEIAEIQGVTEGTVKSRLNYGRKAIKQAVEDYEKKNDVKLHCAGVIPLLLWLFREYAVANNISLTSTTASTTYAAANAAAPIVTEGIKAGAAAAGKFAAKKIIAGIAAAAVITGCVAVGLLSNSSQDETDNTAPSYTQTTESSSPDYTGTTENSSTNTESTEATVPNENTEKVMLWYGYGKTHMATSDGTRFDLEIDSMNDSQIQGTLTRSRLYNISHETKFTGTGNKVDGKIEYTIHFEIPTVLGTIPAYEYDEIQLIYDPSTDCFVMNDFYSVTMGHISTKNVAPLIENKKWSGYGKDIIEGYSHRNDHLFEVEVNAMSETEIHGTVTVYHNDTVDHAFEFSGRGYLYNGTIYYEMLLVTSQTDKDITTYETTAYWLAYDCEKLTLDMSAGLYGVVMYSENLS